MIYRGRHRSISWKRNELEFTIEDRETETPFERKGNKGREKGMASLGNIDLWKYIDITVEIITAATAFVPYQHTTFCFPRAHILHQSVSILRLSLFCRVGVTDSVNGQGKSVEQSYVRYMERGVALSCRESSGCPNVPIIKYIFLYSSKYHSWNARRNLKQNCCFHRKYL